MVAMAVVAGAAALVPSGVALAATGTQTLTLSGGTLSVTNVVNGNINATIGTTATGGFPTATWSDLTGTGNGWNGTIALTSFTYTGTWTQTAGTSQALATNASAAYKDTVDGVVYKVTVGSGATSTSTPFTYTSTHPNNPSGSGTATNGTAANVGIEGITITFASSTTYSAGNVYTIKAGTQGASACVLNQAAGSITPAAGNMSPAPTFVNHGTTVSAGGVNTFGAAVKFVSAAVNAGMGSWTITPGMNVTVDTNSWAATYQATVQYTIAVGP
jgi:hypothetical protein